MRKEEFMLEKSIFCENCRSKVSDIDKLLFVEEPSDRGFCSEDCIKAFYKPFMDTLEKEELEFRKKLTLSQEDEVLLFLTRQKLIDDTIYNPDEVWLLVNDVQQKFYTHIKIFREGPKKYALILICSYVDGSASFVFYKTVTAHENLINLYRRGEELLIDHLGTGVGDTYQEISSEVIESLDRKKSLFLAELLSYRVDDDIDFEFFMDYEKYLKETLSFSDETYIFEDDEGDEIYIFIKSFVDIDNDESFFYVVLCYSLKVKEGVQMIPILSFPSNDDGLYPHYIRGIKLNETLKN